MRGAVREAGRGRPLLVVAHPGHELLVHGWLRRRRPRLLVLTDGSGREGVPRLDRTSALARDSGAPLGPIYGRYPDAALYEALLEGDSALFVDLARELAKELSAPEVTGVVGDAAEGYNPIHDSLRLCLNAAVAMARRNRPDPLPSCEFPLFGRPGPRPGEAEAATRVDLDAPEVEAKREAAAGYSELARELEWSVRQHGERAFRTEWLRPVSEPAGIYAVGPEPPIYERYGEFLRRSGQLARVIRHAHLQRVARALDDATRTH